MALIGLLFCAGDLYSAEPTAALELSSPVLRNGDFQRGASIGFFLDERGAFYEAAHYSGLIDRAVSAGVTHLQLAVRWFQDDVASSHIDAAPGETVEDTVLRETINAARRRGLKVFLMPFVFVRDTSDGSWRGAIAPSDPEAWWSSYRRYILRYAKLAQESGIGLFAVGSELKSLVTEEYRWRALIADVRGIYRGDLIYSANWDNYQRVDFWDALDHLGVNGYFSLSRSYEPSLDHVASAWRRQRDALTTWAGHMARPFILTEVGYRSSKIAPAEPWNHFDVPTPSPEVQLRCYEALYRTWAQETTLGGLYTWNWFGEGGLEEAGFTPYGKPAFEVIRRWYLGSQRGKHADD